MTDNASLGGWTGAATLTVEGQRFALAVRSGRRAAISQFPAFRPWPLAPAAVPEAMITTLPAAWSTGGCSYLGITTTDRAQGISNPIPSDFNPRPKTNPN